MRLPTLKQLKSISGLTAYADSNIDSYTKNKYEYLSALFDVLKVLRHQPTCTIDCYDYSGSYTETVTFKRDEVLTLLDISYDDINPLLRELGDYLYNNYKG
jgi:hypothetical protein